MNLIQLFNSLKVSHKLLLLSAIFALPDITLGYFVVMGAHDNIVFATNELYGDRYQHPLEKLLKDIPEHGILLKRYLLAADEPLKTQLSTKLSTNEKEIDDALAGLQRVDKELGKDLQFTNEGLAQRKREQFRADTLANGWKTLLKASREKISVEESDTKHRALKDHIRTMITHMGDTSNLILDPDLDTYYNMDVTLLALPQTQDRLAEIISYGVSALGKDSLTPEERTQFGIYATMFKEDDVDRVNASLQTALNEDKNFYGIDPYFQNIIPPALASYNGKMTPFIAMLQDITSKEKVPVAVDQFVELGLATRQESFALWDKAVEGEDSLLQIRIHTFNKKLVTALLLTVLSQVVSSLLAFAIARSITRPLRLVVSNLKAQASMDFSHNINLVARSDELGQMAFGMNQVVSMLRSAIQKMVGSSTSLSDSSHKLAMASIELSQNLEQSPHLKDMAENTKVVAKQVAQHAADLQQFAKRFKLG